MPADLEDYGRYAYDAYSRDAGGKSLVTGAELPAWAELPTPVQHAWITAAAAVLDTARSVGDL